MHDLATLFRQLPFPAAPSPGSLALAGATIGESEHRIAKDQYGRPVLLLHVSSPQPRVSAIHLRNLHVEHGVRCRISLSTGIVDDRFSLIHCQSHAIPVQTCFLDLAELILASLPEAPTPIDVSSGVQRMAALFLAIERPPTRAAQGLWGELFLIAQSSNPTRLAEAWHADGFERFDFATDAIRLDVKTSADRSRAHHFTLHQAYPPQGVTGLVASLFVEPSTGSLSLGDLWQQVRDAVSESDVLRLKIDEVCLQTLGTTWEDARSLAYDARLAAESLRIFDLAHIPKPPRNMPNEVTDVRFCSDLSSVAPVTRDSATDDFMLALFSTD